MFILVKLMDSTTVFVFQIQLRQRKSDIGRREATAARVLQRTQAVQNHTVGKVTAARLRLALDAPSRSVDARTVYVTAPGAEPVQRSAEASTGPEWRFHTHIIERVDSG